MLIPSPLEVVDAREAANLLARRTPGDELSAALGTVVLGVEVDEARTEDLDRLRLLTEAPLIVVAVTRAFPLEHDPARLPFDVLLTEGEPAPGWVRPPQGVDAALELISRRCALQRGAAVALVQLLRLGSTLTVGDALVAESLCYSMLLAGPGFATWLEASDRPAVRREAGAAVEVTRTEAELQVTLNRPAVRNAFNAEMRDLLAEAFTLAYLDDSVEHVALGGRGPSFCSGGDLSEFGTSVDPVRAHLIRTTRSPGLWLSRCASKVTAFVHGACVGAGVELAAFAGNVVAADDASFLLPELTMGLIPGAGGTVSLPRRIGRHRCAYLALTAEPIGAVTAEDWHLVDKRTR